MILSSYQLEIIHENNNRIVSLIDERVEDDWRLYSGEKYHQHAQRIEGATSTKSERIRLNSHSYSTPNASAASLNRFPDNLDSANMGRKIENSLGA